MVYRKRDDMKKDFFDKICPKGGKHEPMVIGDTFYFKCKKCGEKEQ